MERACEHMGMRKNIAVKYGYDDRAGDGFNRTAFGRNKQHRARAYKIKPCKMRGYRASIRN